MRNILSFLGGFAIISAVAIPAVLWAGAAPPQVYAKPDNYVITRPTPAKGELDRIVITTTVRKLLNCDIEGGISSPWVSFNDDKNFVPPPSAFTRPNGEPAARTIGNAGDTYTLARYTAVVPREIDDKAATFVVKVPCKLWEFDDVTGEKVWGDAIITTYGPLPVPSRDGLVVDETRAKLLISGALKPGDLK